MASMLISIGIHDAAELKKIGAYQAQLRLLSAGLANHHFYYQALKQGLLDRKWNELDKEEKKLVASEFNEIQKAAQAVFAPTHNAEIPPLLNRALKEIGVI